ncbi:MAG: tetratricopeptide repeat protein [Methylococcaceae bacterium]|nr:tetratricopeptide repeat protein [Methylococcaceae bacterium]
MRYWIAALLVVGAVSFGFRWSQRASDTPRPIPSPASSPPATAPNYIGSTACAACHIKEVQAWKGSHHDLAMRVADEHSVLGDFDNATFEYAGTASTFSKRDGRFFVKTDGPDGRPADYRIQYTFGATPLQQYLIEFPGGRMQALSIAWDSRPKEQGGQRWFHLYPNEHVTYRDELHWTGPQQNWNFMCADCHSTNLEKNYDRTADGYQTTWSEINVACEACHGPGSRHVEWVRQDSLSPKKSDPMKGLTVSFQERQAAHWTLDAQSGNLLPQNPQPLRAEIEVCATCHARRTTIAGGFAAGKAFLDHYQPSLLEPRLYQIDGQQREEVYTWGSFLQSKMFHQGVTCSDCHEPHSLKLRAPGNAVCTRCHAPAKYDAASHFFHEPSGAAGQCVSCHMPATTYMVIDPRRDHSLRVPRPDLSVQTGVPNACNQCHEDRSPQWAAERILEWYRHPAAGFQRYRLAFDGAAAAKELPDLLKDRTQPDIVRATAAALLPRQPDPAIIEAAANALADPSPLVRHAALTSIELLPPAKRVQFIAPLLDDPVRMVRLEVARVLASVPVSMLTDLQRVSFNRAMQEYVDAQRLHADRPEHRTNLGTFYAQLGRYTEAETEFRAALTLQSDYLPAYVNFADLRRLEGRDPDAEAILREGLKILPDEAPLHHALGLTLIRLRRTKEAVPELRQAVSLAPEEAHLAYVYAIALHSTAQTREALNVLNRALGRNPRERELLLAAATFSRDAGDRTTALKHAQRLMAEAPWDPAARQIFQDLRSTPNDGP